MAVILALREPQLTPEGSAAMVVGGVLACARPDGVSSWQRGWIQECDRAGSGEGDKIGDSLPMRIVYLAHRSR
jgi:hypothetical protein